MSRRSTGSRRRSSGGRGRAATRRSRPRFDPGALFRDILTAIRGIAGIDPLATEVYASGLLSLSRGELREPERDAAFAAEVARRLARAATPDALALLHAIAALLGPEAGHAAVSAIDAARAKGVADPVWAGDVAAPRVLDAWSATDELGDQTMVAVTFRHGLWPPHVVRYMVDHNFEASSAKPRSSWIRRGCDARGSRPRRPTFAPSIRPRRRPQICWRRA